MRAMRSGSIVRTPKDVVVFSDNFRRRRVKGIQAPSPIDDDTNTCGVFNIGIPFDAETMCIFHPSLKDFIPKTNGTHQDFLYSVRMQM